MRKRHDREARRRVIEQWQQSGLTGHEFARQAGVSYATLYKWRRELGSSAAFVEVVARDTVASPVESASAGSIALLEIVLPAGVVVRVGQDVDEALLRRVVRALA